MASDAISLPGSNQTLTLKRVCPLVLDDFVGTVTLNDGAYGVPSAQVVKISDTELEIQGYTDGADIVPPVNIRIKINPQDYTVTMPKQVICPDYAPITTSLMKEAELLTLVMDSLASQLQ